MWESAIFVPCSYMGLALLSFLFMRVVMKSWGCEKVIGPPGERMTHVINHQDLHFMREFFSSCSCHFSAASSWISHAINEHGNHHKLVYFYHKKYQFLFIVKLLKSKGESGAESFKKSLSRYFTDIAKGGKCRCINHAIIDSRLFFAQEFMTSEFVEKSMVHITIRQNIFGHQSRMKNDC